MSERDIFIGALQADDPAERRAYLDAACGADDALRRRVDGLLEVYGRAGSFLEEPAVPKAGTVGYAPSAAGEAAPGPEAGVVIAGRYKLLEVIGEGGMGTVWMAEQTEPVRRKVAVKLIKPGMDSRQVLARFEAERQALALMDHPNIAKVHDAGTTAGGRPFFVMELVKGVPITRHCDDQHLTPRQRLELFVAVCQAVQHAHQKGVIHRDIKPSNVLVALYDGRPVVKVIDFGVAKAAGQPLTEKTLFTGLGAVVGTPEYMSPEQAELNNADVDTRSDVFSLGVLLYELLTGSTPLTHKRLKEAALLEVLRLVREEEPQRPSTRLSTAEGLPSIAACRGLEPRKLSGVVRGELDWIVMRALEKDRNRRYETANGFAADVQRYLADEPVLACPPSAGYRFRKFARGNKSGLAIAGLILVCVVLLAGVAGWAVSEQATRRAKLNYGIEVALEEAQVGREQALTQTENPYQWQATLAAAFSVLKRAEELAAQDPAALNDAVAARLQALRMTLDADERDRCFVEKFDEILRGVLVWRDHRSKTRNHETLSQLKRAFLDSYGIHVGTTPAAEAANLLQQRPPPIQLYLLAALDVCVARTPEADAITRAWLQAALDRAENDPARKQARRALWAGDWPALEKLAEKAGKQPPVILQVFVSQLPDGVLAPSERLNLLNDLRGAYPGEFRAPSRFARALNYDILSWLLTTGEDPDFRNEKRALDLSKEAVQLAPNDGDFLNTLGMAHYRVGNWKEAQAALEKATALSDGGDGLDWLILAMVHWRLGNKEEARRRYEQALPWLQEHTSQTFERLRMEAAALLKIKSDNGQ